MEEKKVKRSIDWLSAGFLVMASVSMAVSVPATFKVALLTHESIIGAVLVVFIAEVLAFGAKLATRWFPTWYKQLNYFALVMLSAAILPNAVEGWNALWRENAAEGVWITIRGTTIFGLPIVSLLIVLIWAALPSVGVYVSLTFWVRRQHELETEQTPEAVVNRRLQPILIELQFQKQLNDALRQLMLPQHTLIAKTDEEPTQRPTVSPTEEKIMPISAEQEPQQSRARCSICHKALRGGELGVAVRYAQRHKQALRCTECRRVSLSDNAS